jgi:hypothetical protein
MPKGKAPTTGHESSKIPDPMKVAFKVKGQPYHLAINVWDDKTNQIIDSCDRCKTLAIKTILEGNEGLLHDS